MIDFIATQPHYVDHLAPVWHQLKPEERGSFIVSDALIPLAAWHGITVVENEPGDVLVAAGFTDLNGGKQGRKLVLMEHGIGQTYDGGGHTHYAGGIGRSHVDVFLAPNERVRRANAKASPHAEHVTVGTPKMDAYFGRTYQPSDVPCVSFHWDCDLLPETRNGFVHFSTGIVDLAQDRVVVGHMHPRCDRRLPDWYRQYGIFFSPSFHTVIGRCGVYVCDNSSTLYEFAALDRPVVVLNPPHYRRKVHHGLRFWEYADVGVQCDTPDLLVASVDTALEDDHRRRDRRLEITGELFPVRDGSSASRAAEVLRGIR